MIVFLPTATLAMRWPLAISSQYPAKEWPQTTLKKSALDPIPPTTHIFCIIFKNKLAYLEEAYLVQFLMDFVGSIIFFYDATFMAHSKISYK